MGRTERCSRLGRVGALACLTTLTLAACRTYTAAPVDFAETLRELNAISLVSTETPGGSPSGPALTFAQAASVAMQRNLELQVRRARVGVAQAELVVAGLLPPVIVGWSAGDVLADLMVEGEVGSTSAVAGIGLEWDVPRPGELSSREGLARAGVDEAHARLLVQEWVVVRDVYAACVALAAVEARLAVARELIGTVERTRDTVERGRAAGAATGLQASLAQMEVTNARRTEVALLGDVTAARQELNALLGLPPAALWSLQIPREIVAPDVPPAALAPDEIAAMVEAAVRTRPDLKALRARYEASEAAVRLAIAGQWPGLAIGTGVSLRLPIFSGWNGPEIDVALAERAARGQGLRAAVHEVRRGVFAAANRLERARAQLVFLRSELEPQLERTLRLTSEALRARAVTATDIVTAQRLVLEARTRMVDARFQYARARVELEVATGGLFAQTGGVKAGIGEAGH